MSNRGRPSVRRSLWVLLIVLLLLFLWELNRWLPGAWPGGGGGGALTTEQPTTGQTNRDDPDRTDPKDTDLTRVEAGTTLPKWQRSGVTVEVRAFDGEKQTNWEMGVGDRGPPQTPTKDGTVRAMGKDIFEDGFHVRADTATVRHQFGTQHEAARWAVYLPSRSLPRQRTNPGTVEVIVVTGEGAKPVRGVEVRAFPPRSLEPARRTRTDDQGRVQLKSLRGIVKVAVEGADANGLPWAGETWADPRERDPVTLRVYPAGEIDVVWTSGARAHVARLKTADGRTLVSMRPPADRSGIRFSMARPRQSLRGSRLEVMFSHPDAPDAGASTCEWAQPVPMGGRVNFGALRFRYVALTVLASGKPVPRAKITAYYTPSDAEPEARPLRALAITNDQGKTLVALPADAKARALIEGPGLAPTVFGLPWSKAPMGAKTEVDLLTRAVAHRVRVKKGDGTPASGATILLRMSVDGVRLERTAVANAQGLAQFEDLPPGDVEIHAGAQQCAWGTVATQTGGESVLELAPGRAMVLSIATPRGFPIQGVRAELFATGDEPTVGTDPRLRVFESDAEGLLRIAALPLQGYRVRLTAPGFRSLDIRGLEPGRTTYFVSLVPHTAAPKKPK